MDTNLGTTDILTVCAGGSRSRRRARTALAGVGFAVILALGAGTALAANSDPAPPIPASSMATMDRMHDSELGRSMRQQLPPELRAQMEQMHAGMREMSPSMGDAMAGSNMAAMMGSNGTGPMMGATTQPNPGPIGGS